MSKETLFHVANFAILLKMTDPRKISLTGLKNLLCLTNENYSFI